MNISNNSHDRQPVNKSEMLYNSSYHLIFKRICHTKNKKKQWMILAGRKNQKLSFIGFTVMSALGSSF